MKKLSYIISGTCITTYTNFTWILRLMTLRLDPTTIRQSFASDQNWKRMCWLASFADFHPKPEPITMFTCPHVSKKILFPFPDLRKYGKWHRGSFCQLCFNEFCFSPPIKTDNGCADLRVFIENFRFRIWEKSGKSRCACIILLRLSSFEQILNYTYFVSLHLGKQNTVPCRPGYMCNTCEFVAGTAVHLRNHLETHNDQKTYACGDCNYTGKSKRYDCNFIFF